MNRFDFTTYLTSNTDLDHTLIAALTANCKTKHFNKGDFLLRQGETGSHSFYVEKGLLKLFGVDNSGKEHILQFAPEGWFVADRESAFFKNTSSYNITAIEDTTTLLIDDELIRQLSENYPGFVNFNTKLLHNHIRHLTNRIYQLLSATAEERYLAFVKTYPDILLRVPQTMVASYLGITPESLSRVRKELAVKNYRK